tara:strand:- start:5309 stop:8716 length:3408 start_codon:yes stop_codon:yes gene_type:complete
MTYQFSNTPVYVSEGQTVRFKFKAPAAWNTTLSVTVRIGDQETVWFIVTVPEDFAPDPFPFQSLSDAAADTLYTYADGQRAQEQIITVSGLTPTTEAPMTLLSSHNNANISNAALRIMENGTTTWGDWITAVNVLVKNGDQVQVRLRSNDSPGLSRYLDLSIGTRTERWTINTEVPPPNFPDPFPDFTELYNQPFDTIVYSEVIQIQGLSDQAVVQTDNNAQIGISTTNTTTTNADGFDVLDGVTFVDSSTQPSILNGQYLQLRVTTSTTANVLTTNVLGIGDKINGSTWGVETGDFPSETPGSFSFPNKIDQIENVLISSHPRPEGGIIGLGTDVEVDVVVVNENGGDPGIRRKRDGGWSSWGTFPISVKNGDEIQIRNLSSATFGETISTTIKVGTLQIGTWTVTTNTGPDTVATFTPPTDRTNVVPGALIPSSIIPISGINRPITISATGTALISIDFDTAVAGPRTFDPALHSSIQLFLTAPSGLSQSTLTTVSIGTGSGDNNNNPFTWSVTTYATVPPPPELKGCWYSKKNAFVDMSGGGTGVIREAKDDGLALGTVITVLKQGDGTYGELVGSTAEGRLDSRYPGYLECDGSEYNVADFPDLWWVIKNNYAKTGDDVAQFGTWDSTTKTYTGKFRVPDYRNRRMTGPGPVDGNIANAVSLGIETSTHPQKTYNSAEAGGIGGYWYMDNVDVTAGDPNPYQQVIGDEGATTGISSDFFNFGTVRTVYPTEGITVDIDFEVTGSVLGRVGPLTEEFVNVPLHDHDYVAAVQSNPNAADPVIPWMTPALFAYWPHLHGNQEPWSGVAPDLGDRLGRWAWPNDKVMIDNHQHTQNPTPHGFYFNNPYSTPDLQDNIDGVVNEWISEFGTAQQGTFMERWDDLAIQGKDGTAPFTFGGETGFKAEVKAMITAASTAGENALGQIERTIVANTWWASPGDHVANSYFKYLGGGPNSVYSYSGLQGDWSGYHNPNAVSTAGTVDMTWNPTGGQNGTGAWPHWGALVCGVIDTTPTSVRIDPYTPPYIHEDASDNSTSSHSHWLSLDPLTSMETDYGHGNTSGPGTKVGLATAGNYIDVVFNQNTIGTDVGVGIELNTATFTLNRAERPIPNVKFHPNRQVPIVPEFHKVKYLIKAF